MEGVLTLSSRLFVVLIPLGKTSTNSQAVDETTLSAELEWRICRQAPIEESYSAFLKHNIVRVRKCSIARLTGNAYSSPKIYAPPIAHKYRQRNKISNKK